MPDTGQEHVCFDGKRCQPCEQDRAEWWTTMPDDIEAEVDAMMGLSDAIRTLRARGWTVEPPAGTRLPTRGDDQ